MANGKQEQHQIGGKTFTLLFPHLLRPLSEPEVEDLEESIELRGVLVPVLCDERGGVFDGGHRLRIAVKLGLDAVPFEVRPGLSMEQMRRAAVELNLARRHVGPDDRQRLARGLRQEGFSYRDIAKRTGGSPATAMRDCADLEEGPEEVRGADGKAHAPARPDGKPGGRPRRGGDPGNPDPFEEQQNGAVIGKLGKCPKGNYLLLAMKQPDGGYLYARVEEIENGVAVFDEVGLVTSFGRGDGGATNATCLYPLA